MGCTISCVMQRGFTLLEWAVLMVIIGVLVLLTAPKMVVWADRLAVGRARSEFVSAYRRARLAAVFRSRQVRLTLGVDSLTAIAEADPDSVVFEVPGPGRHGVELEVSRPVVRFAPTGLGFGAANTKVVLRRGKASDSLTTSRLGRLKEW